MKKIILAGVGILALILGFLQIQARPIPEMQDVALHGTYVGISPEFAHRGFTFENSLVELVVDSEGITISQRVGYGSTNFLFKTRYPNKLLASSRKYETYNDAPKCIWLRPSTFGPHSASVCIREEGGIQKLELLGEGNSRSLGVFVKGRENIELLKPVFGQAAAFGEKLRTFDVTSAVEKLKSGDVYWKIHVLDEARDAVRRATIDEVDALEPLVRTGIEDADEEVRSKAFELTTFMRGELRIFLEMAKKQKEVHRDVFLHAVGGLGSTLMLIHSCIEKNAELIRRYGTLDVAQIHQASKGSIEPTEATGFWSTCHFPSREVWTMSDFFRVRDTLDNALMDIRFSDDIIGTYENATRWRKKYGEYPTSATPDS